MGGGGQVKTGMSLEVCCVGLVVGRNFVWRLVIFVTFLGFGRATSWGHFKVIIGVVLQATKVGE